MKEYKDYTVELKIGLSVKVVSLLVQEFIQKKLNILANTHYEYITTEVAAGVENFLYDVDVSLSTYFSDDCSQEEIKQKIISILETQIYNNPRTDFAKVCKVFDVCEFNEDIIGDFYD